MGNACGGSGSHQGTDPGEVLDRVISQASTEDDCLLYQLANYNKGGELVDAFNVGGAMKVEELMKERFPMLMYNEGLGQVITRAEYIRWKFRNQEHIVLPLEASLSRHDPLSKWEDHEACWKMQYRGSLGETLLHILIMCDTKIHTKLARLLLKLFPRLAIDGVEGEEYLGASALHLAIAYANNELVHLLVNKGANIHQRAIGSFFLPRDQQGPRPAPSTDYEGLAYLGEYPLAWAACVGNETVYNLLLDHNAEPDDQDTFGNMILHMVVVTNQLGMYGYALRHPIDPASNGILNKNGLTPLTLACKLGRAEVFKEMLELSAREFWRYSNVTCSGYPLNALDTIMPDGKTNWNSALFIILNGQKEEHLDMLEGGIIQMLLEEKWKTFAQGQFMKRLGILVFYLVLVSGSVYLRSGNPEPSDLLHGTTAWDIARYCFEIANVLGCFYFVIFQQGEEIKNQGLSSFLKNLSHAPPKAIFLVSNFLMLLCIPFRLTGDVSTEEAILAFAVPGSWFFLMFFAGAIRLTGPFVTMIYSMITGDMLTFGIIYCVFALAFSQAFFFLFRSHPSPEHFNTFHGTWMALFHMTLGSYSYTMLEGTMYPKVAKIVFVVFMILVPILLLNMLIAMMGNTYALVIERSEKEWMKQWAKIVVTLELAIEGSKCKDFLREYSIKLSGNEGDPDEVRGVVVIKSKSKTKARQRKGALSNWKHVGKVTIKHLRKRGITGDDLREEIWGHRNSICTPLAQSPRKHSTVDNKGLDNALTKLPFGKDLGGADSDEEEEKKPGMGFGEALSQIAFATDLDLKHLDPTVRAADATPTPPANPPPNIAPVAPTPYIAPVAPAPNITPTKRESPKALQPLNSIPVQPKSLSPPVVHSQSVEDKSSKTRKQSRPEIIIHSEHKESFKVSLDTSDEEAPSGKKTQKKERRSSSQKRSRSIGRNRSLTVEGDPHHLSSSKESLRGETDSDPEGCVNEGYVSDKEIWEVIRKGASWDSHDGNTSNSEKEKEEEEEEEEEEDESIIEQPQNQRLVAKQEARSKSRTFRVKSAHPSRRVAPMQQPDLSAVRLQNGASVHSQDGEGAAAAAAAAEVPAERPLGIDGRPWTAGGGRGSDQMKRWSTKGIANMNKILAWDEPPDDI